MNMKRLACQPLNSYVFTMNSPNHFTVAGRFEPSFGNIAARAIGTRAR
jgi:hypothetical protein